MADEKRRLIALERRVGVNNYAPLPVVLDRAAGVYAYDISGRRYLDFLSSYSALNQGHGHPRIVAALKRQAGRLSLVSRAFYHPGLGPLLERLASLTRQDRAVLMNSGAEAVETAIKAMRLWGYVRRRIPENRAEILVAEGNFHGRTTTIVGFSSDPKSRAHFGPAAPGFRSIPYGDASALERAINRKTAGFLVEPIQGEAGVRVPPAGYMKAVRAITKRNGILLCADEIQTGLGRTGRMFCVDHEGVHPDLIVLGKALSGGLYPVSAVCGRDDVLGLFTPGTHGSTFGANPLACAVAMAALDVIEKEKLPARAAELGAYLYERLSELRHPLLKEVRGMGLLLAIEFSRPLGRRFSELLLRRGLLAKEAHETSVRLAPPLIATRAQLDEAVAILRSALNDL